MMKVYRIATIEYALGGKGSAPAFGFTLQRSAVPLRLLHATTPQVRAGYSIGGNAGSNAIEGPCVLSRAVVDALLVAGSVEQHEAETRFNTSSKVSR